MLSNAGIVTFGPVTGSRVWGGAGTMLPQTIIWYAMLMRSVIKAERTRTANWILRARLVLVLPERGCVPLVGTSRSSFAKSACWNA